MEPSAAAMTSITICFKRWCFIVALLCMAPLCKSDQPAEDIVGKALACFSDNYYYSSSCQQSYRLGAQGSINVPQAAADQYCAGACVEQTNLVLHCVDDIMHNFEFYNGASVQDVRRALVRGCGHGSMRGDFNVLDHQYDMYGTDYGDYFGDGGSRKLPAVKFYLVMLLGCCLLLLLWGY